jgi:hypothetical protein
MPDRESSRRAPSHSGSPAASTCPSRRDRVVARREYREVAPAGGVLIGFHYTTKDFQKRHDIMDFMQPIYLTPSGEKTGAAYGNMPKEFKTVKAPPGYAVGQIRVSGGGLLGGCSLIFMKIDGGGLDPDVKQESPWLGRDVPLAGQPLVGDGRIIIGIHGKLRADGDEEICSIGPIVAGRNPGSDAGGQPHFTRPGSKECGKFGCLGTTRTLKPNWPLARHGTVPAKFTVLPFRAPSGESGVARASAISPIESSTPW